MDCPRCKGHLAPLHGADGLVLDRCPACGGVWFDRGEFAAFYELWEPMPTPDKGSGHTPGPDCPRCKTPMWELTYPPPDGVRIDLCSRCQGMWLDRGEAVALRDRIRSLQSTAALLSEATDSPPPRRARARGAISWPWVLAGIFIIAVTQAVLSGFMQATAALDVLADRDARLSISAIEAISMLASYPVGGFLIGRSSPGFTVWEPAVAAVPASIWFIARLGPECGWLLTALIALLGLVGAVLGAAAGENRQAR